VDSSAPYWPASLVGGKVYNITDGSSVTITAAGASIVGTLAGGTDDDWDDNDYYMIVPPNEDSWVFAEPFCFEIPTNARNGAASDCVACIWKVVNLNSEGVFHSHQLEVYHNLVDNPSMETGAVADPWIPDGLSNGGIDAGDTQASSTGGAVIHSGVDAVQWNVGAVTDERIYYAGVTGSVGDYIGLGCWAYGDGSVGLFLGCRGDARGILQASSSAFEKATNVAAAWVHNVGVWRATHVGAQPMMGAAAGASGNRYSDDFYAISLPAVSITATPASEANSAETSGLRVDGRDVADQEPTNLKANKGRVRFKVTQRHDPADVLKFGQTHAYLFDLYEDANNYLRVYWSAANILTIAYNAQGAGVVTDTYDATGQTWKATEKAIEAKYGASGAELKIGGATVATAAGAVAFATAPSVDINWLHKQDGTSQLDATVASP